MKKIGIWLLVIVWLLYLGYWSLAQAAFHDYGTPSGQRTLSYFLMHQLSYSYQSSAVNVDLGWGGENRSLEISLLGYRSPYVLTNSTYQLGLMGKQKLTQLGNLSFTGVIGVGTLYSSAIGTSLCVNAGGIVGYDFLPGLKFSTPMIASIFSDGGLLDYSAGISFNLAFLGDKEVILGVKGVMMTVIGDTWGFQNSLYALLGIRTNL